MNTLHAQRSHQILATTPDDRLASAVVDTAAIVDNTECVNDIETLWSEKLE
jgi:hypothetical protein